MQWVWPVSTIRESNGLTPMELELEQPLSTTLSVKVSADVELRLDHHCARLRPSGTLSRAALVRSLLNAGLKQLDPVVGDCIRWR